MSSVQTESTTLPSSSSNDDATIEKVESHWRGHFFTAEISEELYTFRVLKMNQSLFIYIGQFENEVLDELAMSVPVEDFVSTTIIGTLHGCDSQELAQQFTRRLKKQVFVSCNIPSNNLTRLMLVKRIAEEMKNVPDAF
ncbi:proteasome assembly chaperone 4-like [Contarinia nasturtii]|uniref:proteasome assembly chaperone 4-like n=1 Tax=Contarinia nasturtii TaxID=265458 RepID=UPI0012D3AC53|nr:proteasome assembly chaperone 4-like [Contarinia nasturtii]